MPPTESPITRVESCIDRRWGASVEYSYRCAEFRLPRAFIFRGWTPPNLHAEKQYKLARHSLAQHLQVGPLYLPCPPPLGPAPFLARRTRPLLRNCAGKPHLKTSRLVNLTINFDHQI